MTRRLVAALLVLAACTSGGHDGRQSAPTSGALAVPSRAALTVADRHGNLLGELPRDSTTGWGSIVTTELTAPPDSGQPIATTVDLQMQQALEQALETVPHTAGRFAAAAIAIDVPTGEIRAAAATTAAGTMLLTPRPTGSALKFLVAAAATQLGALPTDLVDGAEQCNFAVDNTRFVLDGDPQAQPATIETMTANSVNCAYARLYLAAGKSTIIRLGSDLGLPPEVLTSPAIVIGDAAVSPLDMARAFLPVLGRGIQPHTTILPSAHPPAARQVMAAADADATAQLLTTVLAEGGTAATAALDAARPAAAKTGTQDGNTDAWIVGGTAELVVAVWMGNPADPTDGMADIPEYGDVTRVRGGTYPAAIWKTFLDAVLVDHPVRTAWQPTPEPGRLPVRIVAPGTDCPTDGYSPAPPDITHTSADATVARCPTG